MSRERARLALEVHERAVELAREEREAWLRDACGGDRDPGIARVLEAGVHA